MFNRFTLDFEAEFDGLARSFHQLIQRPSLRMAAAKRRNGSYIVAFRITFDYDVELASHVRIGL